MPTGVAATPGVTYCYDGMQPASRLTGLISSNSQTYYSAFDALGRILNQSQATANNTYNFTYTYNLAGSLLCEQYPSGRMALTSYDSTNRIARVSSGTGSCASPKAATPTYVGGTSASSPKIQYAPHGSPWLYAMGNGVWHAPSYNVRLQVCGLQDVLGTALTWNGESCASAPVTGGTSLLTATLNWGTSNNNGNLQGGSFTNSGPGFVTPLPFAQSYTYDAVNRLMGVTDSGYTRNFRYDAYGNMYISGSSGITPPGNAPQAANLYNGHNQFIGGSYDAAGNQTAVNGNTIGYDAENRQATVAGLGVNETYLYDGDGRRVAKGITPTPPNSFVPNTVFVYDAAGQLAAEYSPTSSASPCQTCYLSADQLGTPRLVMDGQGNVVARHDYLPFGEEIAAGQAGRTSQWGAGNDAVKQKFTGKERDQESGLDYFGARYYGSALGRLTSPDAFWKDSHVGDPQSWNKYAYARNNPLRYVDPTGEKATVSTNCTTDDNNHTTCNVNISASIAIYAADGGVSNDDLKRDAKTFASAIDKEWSGSFDKDGVTYNVSTQVSISVADSEQSAMGSGAQNVYGVTSGPVSSDPNVQAVTNARSLSNINGPDTGLINVNGLGDVAHEFTHMLGVPDQNGRNLSNTDGAYRPYYATPRDFGWALRDVTQGVNSNRLFGSCPPDRCFSSPSRPGPSNYSQRDEVGAPFLFWWK